MKKIFSFLYWSKWTDLSVFYFGGDTYLCQGRANEITNKRKFRVAKIADGAGNGITLKTFKNEN